jgi:hypothetical protein
LHSETREKPKKSESVTLRAFLDELAQLSQVAWSRMQLCQRVGKEWDEVYCE